MKPSDTSDIIRYRPAGTALLATHRVEVFWPGDYPSDERWDRFEAECEARGVPFVDVSENDWPTRPVILVNGHIHTAAKWWINNIEINSEATFKVKVSDLKMWIEFLVNNCGLFDEDEFRSDVFICSDPVQPSKHLRAFKDWMMNSRPTGTVGCKRWTSILGTVKAFHVDLLQQWNVLCPFIPRERTNKDGRVHLATGLECQPKNQSAGMPLAPEAIDQLAQACQRIDQDGVRHTSNCAARDLGVLSLAVGSGVRLDALTHLTVFEIPPAQNARADLIKMRVPSAIVKGEAGGIAQCFEPRIQRVREYINGDRRLLLKNLEEAGKLWLPKNPIWIAANEDGSPKADIDGWTPKGSKQKRSWNHTNAKTRQNLLLPNGYPAMIWLNAYSSEPLSYDTVGDLIPLAVKWAYDHFDELFFPPDFHTHDCRHTFSHWLYFLLRLKHSHAAQHGTFLPLDGDEVLQLVSASLGHADLQTTRGTYLASFDAFYDAGVTPDDILGWS